MRTDTWIYRTLDWIDTTARSLPPVTKLAMACVFVLICALLFQAAINAGNLFGGLFT